MLEGWTTTQKVLLFLYMALPLLLIIPERNYHNMFKGFEEAEDVLVNIPDPNFVSPYQVGSLVHLTSSDIKVSNPIRDPDFGFQDEANSIKISRSFEFCQWQEIVTETKLGDDDDDRVVRTYHYIKGWHPYPIMSAFFDQPFAHHNPLRNPFPNAVHQVENVNLGPYTVTHPIINAKNNDWKTKIFTQSELKETNSSVAALHHNFTYVGDGTFYSAYEESGQWKLLRMAGRVLENSLYLFELGDFMSSCTPGDIRMKVSHIQDSTMSVIGKQIDSDGKIGIFTTEKTHYDIGILHTGEHTAEEMLERELKDAKFWLNVWRGLVFIWSLLLFFNLFSNLYGPSIFVLSCLSAVSIISFIWIPLWGVSGLSSLTCLASLASAYFVASKAGVVDLITGKPRVVDPRTKLKHP